MGGGMSLPARNRVTPTGEIVASRLRGLFMGNRGCLHEGREVVRRWRTRAWITCATEFRGRRVQQWAPGRYTVLFFHDEAVALAAGQRPCAECRHPDHRRFLDAWEVVHGERPRAPAVDAVLHAERLDGPTPQSRRRSWRDLPTGVFVVHDDEPALVLGDAVVPWSVDVGYQRPVARPLAGQATVLTPPSTVEVVSAGYRPVIHPRAVELVA